MAIGITQATNGFSGLEGTVNLARQRTSAQAGFTRRTDTTADAASDPSKLFQRQGPIATRIGFGKGTISGPTAVFSTVTRNIEVAKRLIPTTDELRHEQRQRLSERREENTRRYEEFQRHRPEFRVPEPSAQARRFVNELDRVASYTQARIEGQEVPAGPGRAAFEVDGQTYTFTAPGRDVAEPEPGQQEPRPRIDVFV